MAALGILGVLAGCACTGFVALALVVDGVEEPEAAAVEAAAVEAPAPEPVALAPWLTKLAACARDPIAAGAPMVEAGRITDSYDCDLPGGEVVMVTRGKPAEWRVDMVGNPPPPAALGSSRLLTVDETAIRIDRWHRVDFGPLTGAILRYRVARNSDGSFTELTIMSEAHVIGNPYQTMHVPSAVFAAMRAGAP